MKLEGLMAVASWGSLVGSFALGSYEGAMNAMGNYLPSQRHAISSALIAASIWGARSMTEEHSAIVKTNINQDEKISGGLTSAGIGLLSSPVLFGIGYGASYIGAKLVYSP